MSTLKVNSIKSPSSSTGGIEIDSSGAITGALPYPNRNLLYNGAMQVAQRGTSTAGITSGGYYTADRWFFGPSIGTWTETVENDAPVGSGFRKSLKMLCTTADASPAANLGTTALQLLEGQDVQYIKKGTSAAETLTLSFWVKSNVTGTYAINCVDIDNTRAFNTSYQITSSGTWEKKTLAIPADTTGVLDNDNQASLRIQFWLASGSDFTSGTFNSAWESLTNANRAVGQTNLAAATSNYWQITGLQLEVGDTATEFEFKSYGQELAECQRYYEIVSNGATGTQRASTSPGATLSFPFKVSKRVAPTAITHIGNYTIGCPALNGPFTVSAASTLQAATTTGALVDVATTGTTGTNGSIAVVTSSTEASGVGFAAEI